MCMYVVFCKIDHCIHIHWCIVMGLGHNDPWVEWPQQTWGQRSSRGQWPLVQVFGKKGQCIHILWCIFKSNITMIAKVCDRESRRDKNRLVWVIFYASYYEFEVPCKLLPPYQGDHTSLLAIFFPCIFFPHAGDLNAYGMIPMTAVRCGFL